MKIGMKMTIVCETWGWFLPLLKCDEIATNSHQMISMVFKRPQPLPRANPPRVLSSGHEAACSHLLGCQ